MPPGDVAAPASLPAIAAAPSSTTVECPSENMNPTATGRLPSCINLRVTLSIAAMWSASTRVAQTKAVREKGRSQEKREMMKGDTGPQPRAEIEDEQEAVYSDDPILEVIGVVVE